MLKCGVALPSSMDLPNPGKEPPSPTVQAASLPSEPPGKPIRCFTFSLCLAGLLAKLLLLSCVVFEAAALPSRF